MSPFFSSGARLTVALTFGGIALGCHGEATPSAPPSPTIDADPIAGLAPLAIVLTAGRLSQTGSYQITFGDGSSEPLALIAPICPAHADCSHSWTASTSHTYQSPGTYTATLETDPCSGDCVSSSDGLLASVTITVRCKLGACSDDAFLPVTAATIPQSPGAQDAFVGAADFNGDGTADLLWQRSTDGLPTIWLMANTLSMTQGGIVDAGGNPVPAPGAEWKLVGSPDFDGDRKPDLLWQRTDGTPAIWLLDGRTLRAASLVQDAGGANLPGPGADWQLAAAADFDGDGRADVLWRDAQGDGTIWFLNGLIRASYSPVANSGTDYQLAGVTDLNGDGKADIIWQNAGALAVWLMNGATTASGAVLQSYQDGSPILIGAGAVWRLVGAGAFGGRADAGLVVQNRNDGSIAVLFLNGGTTAVATASLDASIGTGAALTVCDLGGNGALSVVFQNVDGTLGAWNVAGDPYGILPGPHVQATEVGAAELIYSGDHCIISGLNDTGGDIPDEQARVFHDADGNVVLYDGFQDANFRNVGPTLDSVVHTCSPVMQSIHDTAFDAFTYFEWIESIYSLDGQTVYAKVHNEWYPYVDGNNPQCSSSSYAAAIALTLAVSTDGGATFRHPADYQIRIPAPWSAAFPCCAPTDTTCDPNFTVYGANGATNTIAKDGYYYTLFSSQGETQPTDVYDRGMCLMRTGDLATASAYEVWTRDGWQGALRSRCAPIDPVHFSPFFAAGSLTYNTYLSAYLLTGLLGADLVYSLSSDLFHWSAPGVLITNYGPSRTPYASLIDPTDTSRNFERSGQEPYVYYTRFNATGLFDRDLLRQKIHLTIAPPLVR